MRSRSARPISPSGRRLNRISLNLAQTRRAGFGRHHSDEHHSIKPRLDEVSIRLTMIACEASTTRPVFASRLLGLLYMITDFIGIKSLTPVGRPSSVVNA